MGLEYTEVPQKHTNQNNSKEVKLDQLSNGKSSGENS